MSDKTVNLHEAKTKKRSQPLDDPLLRVKEYGYDGPIGPTGNEDIERTVYGIRTGLWRKSGPADLADQD